MDSFYLLAASISGLIARFVTYPLDTLKTRIQTSTHINHQYDLISLFHGVGVSLMMGVPAVTVYLSCYEYIKQSLNELGIEALLSQSVLNQAISSMTAEMSAGLIFTPMEVIKSQLQLEKNDSVSAYDLIRKIAREDSIGGFFRGYWLSLMVYIPHSVVYFIIYEHLKAYWEIEQRSLMIYLLCASIAAGAALTASTPLDLIKTRWQVSAEHKDYQIGPLGIAHHMYRHEGGVRVFFRGLWMRIAWGIPNLAINMSLFDLLIQVHNKQ